MHKPCLMSQHLPRATKVRLVGGLRVQCCVFFSRYACMCVESTSARTDSGKKKKKTAMVLESTIPAHFMGKLVLPADRFVRAQVPLSGHSGFPWVGSRVERLGSLLQHMAKIVTPIVASLTYVLRFCTPEEKKCVVCPSSLYYGLSYIVHICPSLVFPPLHQRSHPSF